MPATLEKSVSFTVFRVQISILTGLIRGWPETICPIPPCRRTRLLLDLREDFRNHGNNAFPGQHRAGTGTMTADDKVVGDGVFP